ncbi:unnamed protein product [Cercospora beticola]|nr:unnamed protein product [Cercospora beticola]
MSALYFGIYAFIVVDVIAWHPITFLKAVTSSVAQRKRAGLITRRALDRN